jgi:hypothetical protein
MDGWVVVVGRGERHLYGTSNYDKWRLHPRKMCSAAEDHRSSRLRISTSTKVMLRPKAACGGFLDKRWVRDSAFSPPASAKDAEIQGKLLRFRKMPVKYRSTPTRTTRSPNAVLMKRGTPTRTSAMPKMCAKIIASPLKHGVALLLAKPKEPSLVMLNSPFAKKLSRTITLFFADGRGHKVVGALQIPAGAILIAERTRHL